MLSYIFWIPCQKVAQLFKIQDTTGHYEVYKKSTLLFSIVTDKMGAVATSVWNYYAITQLLNFAHLVILMISKNIAFVEETFPLHGKHFIFMHVKKCFLFISIRTCVVPLLIVTENLSWQIITMQKFQWSDWSNRVQLNC